MSEGFTPYSGGNFFQSTDIFKSGDDQLNDPIYEMIQDSKTSIIDICKCTSFQSLYKKNDKLLNERLTQINTVNDLMSFLILQSDREMIYLICSLFLSTNQTMLRYFVKSPDIIESFSQILYNRNNIDYYKTGLITKIISEAMRKYPQDLFDILYSSPTFWSSSLQNLDIESVSNCVLTLSQSNDEKHHSFLWGYLLPLIPNYKIQHSPSTKWDVKNMSINNCKYIKISTSHRVKIYKLFTIFIRCFPNEKEFTEIIIELLPQLFTQSTDTEETSLLLDLASTLPPQKNAIAIALSHLKSNHSEPIILQKSIDYINIHFSFDYYQFLIIFLFRLFSTSENNFVLSSAIKLVERMSTSLSDKQLFSKCMQHIIYQCWNKRKENCPLLVTSSLISVALLISDGVPSFDGWYYFQSFVLEPFKKGKQIQKNYKIPSNGIDFVLIDSLVVGAFEQQMKNKIKAEIKEEFQPKELLRRSKSVISFSRVIVNNEYASEAELKSKNFLEEYRNKPKKNLRKSLAKKRGKYKSCQIY